MQYKYELLLEDSLYPRLQWKLEALINNIIRRENISRNCLVINYPSKTSATIEWHKDTEQPPRDYNGTHIIHWNTVI